MSAPPAAASSAKARPTDDDPSREIERQRGAGSGEGEITPALAPHGLEDGEERGGMRAGRGLEQRADAGGGALVRQHRLELMKTAAAIDPVPVRNAVERIEKT